MTASLHLITGATGLVGSHVAAALAARGERVRALVRPTSDTAFLRSLGAEPITGDLNHSDSLRRAADGAMAVYHCAARVGDWGAWSDFRSQVVDATARVVAACQQAGVQRLVHVSSISVYGHPPAKPCITEDEPLGQRLRWLDHYCRAKTLAEQEVAALGPGATIVRPSWIYGPRDRNTLPRLAQALRGGWVKILGPGNNRLNVVHASDVADGAIRAATAPSAAGRVYHLCGPGDITQREFLDTLTDALGLPRVTRHVSPRLAYLGGLFGDVFARVCRWQRAPFVSRYSVGLMTRPATFSTERARKELGWEPRVATVQGLRDAVAGKGF